MGALDGLEIVNSDDNAIAKWVTINLEYLPSIVPASDKQSFDPGLASKQTTDTDNEVVSDVENSVDGNGANNIGFDSCNSMSGDCVGCGAEVSISGNPEKRLAYLGV